MLETLNYQSIIDVLAIYLVVSMPIAILFGITVKLVRLFLSMVFGEKEIKL